MGMLALAAGAAQGGAKAVNEAYNNKMREIRDRRLAEIQYEFSEKAYNRQRTDTLKDRKSDRDYNRQLTSEERLHEALITDDERRYKEEQYERERKDKREDYKFQKKIDKQYATSMSPQNEAEYKALNDEIVALSKKEYRTEQDESRLQELIHRRDTYFSSDTTTQPERKRQSAAPSAADPLNLGLSVTPSQATQAPAQAPLANSVEDPASPSVPAKPTQIDRLKVQAGDSKESGFLKQAKEAVMGIPKGVSEAYSRKAGDTLRQIINTDGPLSAFQQAHVMSLFEGATTREAVRAKKAELQHTLGLTPEEIDHLLMLYEGLSLNNKQ